MFELNGRNALITGAGRGNGVGMARTLAKAGAQVWVNDYHAERAERTAAILQSEGYQAHALAFDVTNLDAYKAAVEQVPGVDILVNNAGIIQVSDPRDHFSDFLDSKPETAESQIALNLYGLMNGARAVLPHMRAQGWGRIITISSDSGRMGSPGQAPYASAKAAGLTFSRTLGTEEGKNGITANSISLGLMENAAATPDPNMAAYFDSVIQETPVRRTGTGEDVGAAIVFLSSNEAEWITGQNLPVNGGYNTY